MRNRFITLVLIVAAFLSSPAGAADAQPAESAPNALRITGGRPIRDYTILTLTNPSRLVIDIPYAVPDLRLQPLPADRLGIGSIRVEDGPKATKIILNAAQGGLLPYRVKEDQGGLWIFLEPPEQWQN